jgi:uncharacterized membrane protein
MKMPFYKRSWFLWVVTIIFTLLISFYQRATGPTYPISGKTMVGNHKIEYKFIRSDEVVGETEETEIAISAPEAISGTYIFKRYKSYDDWTEKPLKRDGENLILSIPRQPKAGKVEYQLSLTDGDQIIKLPEEPVIMRYKGVVPKLTVLLPHVLLMLLAMIFSTRTGLEALARRKNTLKLTIWTLVFLTIGGLILGPIMQNYAFDAYWTGWPFGHDLTDNKTAVAFIFWIVALVVLFRNKQNRTWAVVAAIVLLAVYTIPHSALGSEIDYTKIEQPQTELQE